VAVLLLGALVGVWLTEDVAADTVPTKNASYFVNPKQFLTYVGQMDKIKSLGEEVHCKLHGTCTDKRRKIPKKISSLASKKSIASRPRGRMPDNHNNVLSPEAMMSPVAGGMLGANEYTQQPERAIRSVRSVPTEVLKVNTTTNANDNENSTTAATPTNSSAATTSAAASPVTAAANKTAPAVNAPISADAVAQNVSEAFPPTVSNSSTSSPPITFAENSSVASSPLLNVSNIGNNITVANTSTLNSANQTIASKPVDSKAIKKSLASTPRISEDLPPIYLTVKNGEKVLVVHPTTEFLQSLPRINFTDPASEKPAARSSGRVRHAKGYTGIYAKRDEMMLLKKTQKEEIGERKTDVKEEADDAEEYNSDDNSADDNNADEDAEDSDNDDDDDDEGSSDANANERSKITYATAPVYSPRIYGRLNAWTRNDRSRISQRDRIRNMDSIRSNQLGNIYTADEYLKGERKSSTAPELPVPRAIQNLYRKFHPEHSKANFQYIPSRDEVAEELQYAQQSASLNNAMQGSVEQNPESDLQAAPDADYGNDGDVGDGATARMSNNEPTSWEQKYKNLDSDGRKRSENPMDYD